MEWTFAYCFQVELEFRTGGFCGGRKPGDPGEKYLEHKAQEPTKQVNHVLCKIWDMKLGHTGEKQTLSLLHHHCSSTKSSQRLSTK